MWLEVRRPLVPFIAADGADYTRLLERLPPARPQVRQEMMMLKRLTMPPMMACRMEPMALTMPIRQAPMALKIEEMQETTAPMVAVVVVCVVCCLFGILVFAVLERKASGKRRVSEDGYIGGLGGVNVKEGVMGRRLHHPKSLFWQEQVPAGRYEATGKVHHLHPHARRVC